MPVAANRKLVVRWHPYRGADYYKVFRNDGLAGITGIATYIDTVFQATRYVYRVEAYDADDVLIASSGRSAGRVGLPVAFGDLAPTR
jgi:hypothetical protein